MPKKKKKTDAVFEGGGVKGIAFAGAVSVIEQEYEFVNLAGTSAGAIMAALLAVGYSANEIKKELQTLNYGDFRDEGILDKIPLLGKAMSIGFEYGIYEGDYFEDWFEQLLHRKGKTKFKDVLIKGEKDDRYKYKLQVIASDITDKKLLVLPGDLKEFGYNPDEFSISRAVRMSMSIPIFFEPVRLSDSSGRDHYIVDGGALSNYPVWLLDDGSSKPPWPTIGFKLIEPGSRELKRGIRSRIKNPFDFLKAIIATMMEAHDSYHISESSGDYERTIGIQTVIRLNGREKEIKATDFDITQEDGDGLFQNGADSATSFLKTWDFNKWVKKYRKKPTN
jgi:NTE family protein